MVTMLRTRQRPLAHVLRAMRLFAVLVVALGTIARPSGAREPATPQPVPVVIAVVESGGLNVLHSDYRRALGRKLRLSNIPGAQEVRLPAEGSFEERIEALKAGPLGNMEPGTLYRIPGTRIVGLFSAFDEARVDITADRAHATGTTSSAVGLAHGTYPEGLLVYVADTSRPAWEWLAEQQWIDVISTSYSTLPGLGGTCGPMRQIADQGRVIFSAMGNNDPRGTLLPPSGVAENYQVGGVDAQGRSYRPDGGSLGTNRPYETGDRFRSEVADPDSFNGSRDFGGTSGATPSTAGRAADLIAFSRRLLKSDRGFVDGALVSLGPRGLAPRRGPLSDGQLTRSELFDLMHHTAVPAEAASPLRYLVEGYGAFQEESVELAKRILAGREEEPSRPQEDQIHELVEAARSLAFPEARCDWTTSRGSASQAR